MILVIALQTDKGDKGVHFSTAVKVNANDGNAILGLLDDVRKLSRSMADIQMKNKLSV